MFAFIETSALLLQDGKVTADRSDEDHPKAWNHGETPLGLVRPGQAVTIVRIAGRDDLGRRLGDLGLVPGDTVTLMTHLRGNLILKVRGSRIALSAAVAHRILVKPEKNQP